MNAVFRTIADKIEADWSNRAKAQYLDPNDRDEETGESAYMVAQAEFFVGAMSALNAAFPSEDGKALSSAIPPSWVICIMSGRPIVDLT